MPHFSFMRYGVCILSNIPQRREPSDPSEMVNEVLFGEIFTITDEKNQWRKIKLEHDGYEGWVDEKQIRELSQLEFEDFKSKESTLIYNDLAAFSNSNEVFKLVKGCIYRPLLLEGFISNVKMEAFNATHFSDDIITVAKSYLNSPYLWGGRTNFGIDCSGFTQMVFKFLNIPLLRDASQQVKQGELVENIENSNRGDLAFFENSSGKTTHVGILIDKSTIIHASGKVRIDYFNDEGIIHSVSKERTHKLSVIKRIFTSD